MKTKHILTVLILSLSWMAARAQSEDKNYILSRTYTGTSQYQEEIVYHDGLGRPVQTVRHGASPMGDDIVTNLIYDGLGRVGEQWLAGTSGMDGEYVSNDYLMSRVIPLHDGDLRSFISNRYEASGDGRLLRQQLPGELWYDAEKAVEYDYRLNTSYGELSCLWVAKTSSSRDSDCITVNGAFAPGCLNVTRITDEDGRVSLTFVNEMEQTLLERIVLSESQFLDTYYVYDLYGNICAVLPPMASAKLTGSEDEFQDALEAFAYIYGYDQLNRCTRKKLPGAEWIYYRYDRSGHCIFTQDGELRKESKWRFSIPDAHGREVMSGVCANTNTDDFSDKTVCAVFNVNESLNGSGYYLSNLLLVNPEFQTIMYYDSYDYLQHVAFAQVKNALAYDPLIGYIQWNFAYNGKEISKRGLLTGKRVYTLGDTPSMTASAYYYDQWNHLSQMVEVNQVMNTSVREWRSNTMSGLPLRKTREIQRGNCSLTEQYTYTYDHAERLLSIRHKLNDFPEATLVTNEYDELGRLRNKALSNGSDTLSYAYNVRDWITSVSSDDFTQHLFYNFGLGTKQYSGYISGTRWQHGDDMMRSYAYSYDGAGRLMSGQYREYMNGNVISGTAGRFDENVMSYDLNGNPEVIRRKGKTAAGTYAYTDVLNITMDGNRITRVQDMSATGLAAGDNDFVDGVNAGTEYTYNSNGCMTSDLNRGILSITYNSLSLPLREEFSDGAIVSFVYDAEGTKLRVTYSSPDGTVTTDYLRGLLFENDEPQLLLTPTGYLNLSDNKYRHYIHDHQGNIRVVKHQDGAVEETNDYYPFGGRLATSTSDIQPFKYSGKELEARHGLHWYDFGARRYDPALARWTTPDPLSEKYYGISPYAFCNNNPVNFVDPDGMGIYQINSRGYITRMDDRDDVHQLYLVDHEGNRTGDMIELSNSDALESLSKTDSKGVSSYQTNRNIDNLFKIFKFVADNTDVEWAVHRSYGNGYIIGTSHEDSSVESYSALSGDVNLPIASVHSHPRETTYASERSSMGYDDGWVQYGNDHQKAYWGTVPKFNYVYFPISKRLYNVECYNPRYIRNIGGYKDFYFGTLNYK